VASPLLKMEEDYSMSSLNEALKNQAFFANAKLELLSEKKKKI